jgi:hypothetical protein
MSSRTTREVFEDHLCLRKNGDLEQDLQRNYHDDVVLICDLSVLRGRDAIRESARRLGFQLPGAKFEFIARQVVDEYAFLVWKAKSDTYSVRDGVDTFVIHQGRIIMQSIRYTLIPDAQSAP